MTMDRLYPVGIQTFSEIINKGYVYIDKTDQMWRMQRLSKYVFLGRPRRFGKSLLATTLCSFFEGRRELFEGLKVMELEKEWRNHPVLHIDLSCTKGQEGKDDFRRVLTEQLEPYAELYGKRETETTPGMLFNGLIRRAYEQTGEQVVVVIDEYDAPLLEVLPNAEQLPVFHRVMQEFFQCLKARDAMIRFCFITGITKFSNMSVFCNINNLTNISLLPEFSTICGITDNEIDMQLQPDVERLAEEYEVTHREMRQMLRETYDGYHFSAKSPNVYNPFSLMKAFNEKTLENNWFETSTPNFLLRHLRRFRTNYPKLDGMEVPSSAFNQPMDSMRNALPLLFQSGHLTIKGYDRISKVYTLGFPNQEVRVGMTEFLLPIVAGLKAEDVQTRFALNFWQALRSGEVTLAIRVLHGYLTSLPRIGGFKKKLEKILVAETFYEWLFYLIFSSLNNYVQTLVKCANRNIDIVVFMPDAIYVIELKINGTAKEAMKQIEEKSYALRYANDPRRTVKVGVAFSMEKRTLTEFVIAK